MDPDLRGLPDYRQWADTWSTMGVATVGVDNLDGADMGEACAEDFELAWRRANN